MKTHNGAVYEAVILMVDFCNESETIFEFLNSGCLDQQNNTAVYVVGPR